MQTAPGPKSGWGLLEGHWGSLRQWATARGHPRKQELAIEAPATSHTQNGHRCLQVRIVAWGSADCRPSLPSCVGLQAGLVLGLLRAHAPRPARSGPGLANCRAQIPKALPAVCSPVLGWAGEASGLHKGQVQEIQPFLDYSSPRSRPAWEHCALLEAPLRSQPGLD